MSEKYQIGVVGYHDFCRDESEKGVWSLFARELGKLIAEQGHSVVLEDTSDTNKRSMYPRWSLAKAYRDTRSASDTSGSIISVVPYGERHWVSGDVRIYPISNVA